MLLLSSGLIQRQQRPVGRSLWLLPRVVLMLRGITDGMSVEMSKFALAPPAGLSGD